MGGEEPEDYSGEKEGHEEKGPARVVQRNYRRHNCCLLSVWGTELGLALRRIESFGSIFLGNSKRSL